MSLRSLLSSLRDKWSGRPLPRSRRNTKNARRPSLRLEALESRELLAAPAVPKIIFVNPPDGGSVVETASPNKIIVQYSEAMDPADQVKANYLLFGPTGAVTISSVALDGTLTNAYDITFAAGQVGGAYTLFVQGDKVHEATDTFTLAQPGQLVVANSAAGQGTISTINAVDGSSILNAVQPYPMGQGLNPVGEPTPTPTGVAIADFNGDGIPDLAVANSAFFQSTVDVYAGLPGGGFNATPDASLPMDFADVAAGSIVAFSPNGPLAATGFADIAVTGTSIFTGAGDINVFINNRSTGAPSFATEVTYAPGATTPGGLIAGDFNNDGRTDLAVVDDASPNVDFLPGNGNGTFGAPVAVATTGLTNPTSLAGGALATANSKDLAVGGSNGVVTLINAGTVGAFNFTVNGPYGPLNNVSSVAIGNINGDGLNDVVASSSTSGNVEVLANADDGTGAINPAASQTFSLGSGVGNVVGLALNGNGLDDIVVASTNANQVTVLQNSSTPASFNFAAPASYAVDVGPVALGVAPVYGDTSPDIITADQGVGFGGANNTEGGTFSVLRNAGDGTYLVSNPLPDQGANAQPDSVAVGDLNGDGLLDMVVANGNANTVSVYLAAAPGVYNAPVTYSVRDASNKGNGPVSVTLANLTGNANQLDIITADKDGFISVLANDGSGNFAPAVTFAVGTNPTQVVAGIFDASGHVSLAVAHNGPGPVQNARGVTLLLGNGNRTFQAAVEILPNVAATALVAGNFASAAGAPLDLVVANDSNATVVLLQNNGAGAFTNKGSFAVGPHPSALAAADFNRDGLLDVVAVSRDTTNGVEQISTLLNSGGSAFAGAVTTPLPFNFAASSVSVTDVNVDEFPDLVVGLLGAPNPSENAPADPTFYTLTGNGDGTFGNPIPYLAGGQAGGAVVGVVSDALVRATTFTLVSKIVKASLVENGGFEGKDLSGAQGNLIGWQTAQVPDSRGAFLTQTGTLSPLSQTAVPAPSGGTGQNRFRAMVDQSHLIPLPLGGFFDSNSVQSYAGSNFLYQLVTLPATATSLSFSISLYLQSLVGWTSGEPSLFYNNPDNTNPNVGNDQQVRVDIMDPNAPGFLITDTEADGKGDVIQNIFQTTSTTARTVNTTLNVNLSSLLANYAGKQVMIRIAAVNNKGLMIAGVDNVSMTSLYTDTTPPTFAAQLQLRNPGYLTGPSNPPVFSTTDPTFVGQVADDGGVQNIAYVAFSPTGDSTFNQPGDFKITPLSMDPTGHFSVTLPNPVFGLNTVSVEVVDRAGNATPGTTISFVYQGPSVTNWQAEGPGAISTANSGVQYSTVAGRINGVLVDPQDPTGDTYLIGSENGGVWKTTDGGANWTPATDYVFDKGNPINVPIGALAGAVDTLSRNGNPPTNNFVVYAATGDANPMPDSRAGSGILVSTNGGASFVVAGNSDVVLAGARISRMAVDPADTNIAYAAVASGGEFGPGVYKTTDGGQTWTNVLTTTSMNLSGLGFAGGTTIASVTDLSLNSHDPHLLTIGLGNIGLVGVSATAGVWTSQNDGLSWQPVLGGGNPNVLNSTLPGARPAGDPLSGTQLGRVTLAQGFGTTDDISTVYVLIASPPGAVPLSGDNINFGTALDGTIDATPIEASNYHNTPTLFGLYKNGGQINGNTVWTHVMIREQAGPPAVNGGIPPWRDLDLTGVDGSNVGAIIVDPTDPNVVYVGASEEYPLLLIPPDNVFTPQHGLLRIDTGNMLDTTTLDPITRTFLNTGDDVTKRVAAFDDGSDNDFDYHIPNGTNIIEQGYLGEGVSWVDLSTNAFNNDFGFGGAHVPPNITSVAIDAQGRLVFGTEQGLYRLTYHGVGYDYSSGGQGILAEMAGAVEPPAPQIQLNAIDGNMQIADLTSVAIDPTVPGRIYTTQFGTGATVIASGPNSATTMGLTGFIGIPDGDKVLVGNPDPNAAPGTLNTVYLLYAYGDKSALVAFQPVSSTQGGALTSFIDLPTTNLGYTDNAGYLPFFTEFQHKVSTIVNGKLQFFDELLLGTDRIYVTSTSAGVFSQVPSNGPLSKKGGVITAASFAPTNDQIIFAGTNKGEVFVTENKGGDFFQEIDNNTFAGGTINSITVDPNNPNLVYVTVGGVAGKRIFKGVVTVSNGKATAVWTNITGNLGAIGVNALVDDPRSQAQSGAPNGRLYVGTDVGVYVSVNGGGSWAPLGNGGNDMPHVPVIDLEFNQSLEELVAGTQGRGVFMISTDRIGPHVVSVSPATPVNTVAAGALTSVTVTFNKPISSFPLNQVSIVGPSGQVITPTAVTDVSVTPPGGSNPHNAWQIAFPSQSAQGIYTFRVGPNVLDLVGNPMDQNGNGVNGESPGDIFTFTVDLNSTDDGQFVSSLYRNLLNRPADTVGFETVLAPIDAARFALLPGYATAYVLQQGEAQLVQDLYGGSGSILGISDLIGRAATTSPNGGEIGFWMGLLQQGLSFEPLIQNLVSSQTFFVKSGVDGNDANWLNQLYLGLDHRPVSGFEDSLFLPQLAGAEAASRTQDALNLLSGQAYQTRVIQQDYQLFLNRPASGNEVALWLGQFQSGMTQELLIANILSSGEYFNTDAPAVVGGGATPSTDTWVRAVYKQLFPGYNVSQNEINFWDIRISTGALTLQQVGLSLATSNLRLFGSTNGTWAGTIAGFYSTYMGRPITQGDTNYWMSVYAANPNYRTENVIANILGSSEYFARNTTANTPLPSQDKQWADALYTVVLGSTNSSSEQNTDLPFLATAEYNARASIAALVLNSGEYRTDVIDFVYQNYLLRAPSAFETNLWLPIVGQAAAPGGLNGDMQLVEGVLASGEYFNLQSDPTDNNLHTNNSWLTSLYSSLRVPFNAPVTVPGASAPGAEAANLFNLLAAYAPTRLNTALQFVNGGEYRFDVITADYNTILGRNPQPSEITTAQNQFAAGGTQEQLIANLLGTPEFFTRSPIVLGQNVNPSNTTFVEAAYKLLFPNYAVSQNEVNFWVNQLNAKTITTTQVATSLVTSNLYRFGSPTNPSGSPYTNAGLNGFVNRMYVALLGRNATQNEINFWMSIYQANPNYRTENFIASILESNEYFEIPTHTIP